MNKLMIVLGLLLVVGLSVARPTFQYPWQSAVFDRYYCHIENVPTEQYYVGYYMYQYMQPYITSTQMQGLLDHTNGMQYYLFDGMASDYYVAPFRADMMSYNSNNMAFRTIFNAMLRTYFAHGGDREYVLGLLNTINQDYRSCLNPVA